MEGFNDIGAHHYFEQADFLVPELLLKELFRRFGGFPSDLTYGIEAAEMYELALEEGIELPVAPLWTQTYDGPNVIVER